jgi:cephalosporin hydroxylase
MNNRIWIIRTVLISAIVGLAVYIHGRSESTVIERFHKISYWDHRTFWENHWMGVPALQNANDAWIIQEIISETKPDFIVEAGTFFGGSALLWASVLHEVNPGGKVITLDIENKSTEARKFAIAKQMITFIIGSSTDPKVVDEISREVKGKKVLVILDSDHHRDHVLKELKSYSPLVQVGGYLVVQDSNINGHPVYITDEDEKGPGPYEAIEAFLAGDDHFQPDLNRERMIYTTNPHGYLKRVK